VSRQPNRTCPREIVPDNSDRTVGALYVTSLPVAEPDDITFRMLRTLREVALVVALDIDGTRRALSTYDISTPLSPVTPTDAPLAALAKGDVALILADRMSIPSASELALIQAAVQRGHPVLALPGPTLPIATLVASGMPASSFVYLGALPPRPPERRGMLREVVGEHRTLLAIESPRRLPALLTDLRDLLGDRPLTVTSGGDKMWRGTVIEALEQEAVLPRGEQCILVVGGSREDAIQWDEDHLRDEILNCLSRGLGVKDTSQHLAPRSGWPRRMIYDMAVEINQLPTRTRSSTCA
jgi:16S rRNA (cytidine1402-2'-O)-methyltransferase